MSFTVYHYTLTALLECIDCLQYTSITCHAGLKKGVDKLYVYGFFACYVTQQHSRSHTHTNIIIHYDI